MAAGTVAAMGKLKPFGLLLGLAGNAAIGLALATRAFRKEIA